MVIDAITAEHCKTNTGYVGDSFFQWLGLGAGARFQC